MHIHPNNSLQLASLGIAREELHELQARRAAEVRRKLSSASRLIEDSDDLFGPAGRVEQRSYESERRRGRETQGEDESFGRHFSAKA